MEAASCAALRRPGSIDWLAKDFRALNFNVEAQCTPSRAALMTGRYAVRTGNGTVPLFAENYGLTRWEVTLSEMLSQTGYATAIFGKWHLGDTPGRFPTDRGFDEWYGIPNSSDESFLAAEFALPLRLESSGEV